MSDASDEQSAVVLRAVTKSYSAREGPVLQSIDLQISVGQFLSIVGPSGCGKSTLLGIVAGLTRVSSGTVDVFGERISGPYAGIGVVSQAATLFPWRSVVENVLLPAHILGVPDSIGRPQALKLIAQVGLKGQEHRYPHELSGGMAQRVAVARALMNNPRILLLDEPFGSLDGLTRGVLNLELTRAWEATRATALLVTHSIEEAVFLSDKIAVLSGRPGHIIGLVDVPLPRPRTLQDRRTASFVEVSSRIDDLLAAQLP